MQDWKETIWSCLPSHCKPPTRILTTPKQCMVSGLTPFPDLNTVRDLSAFILHLKYTSWDDDDDDNDDDDDDDGDDNDDDGDDDDDDV
ncbi:hypothetical protein E2C01_027313 [Portunus trituberculatus]|uniref:Uncharacterized protein n=1 Tax=Portunus trituberculatus TaxID=210409 RepID=A0A5B7ENE9_PORTR|nr:hypothetical protein [Portunus trituberculatus]